MSTIEPIAGAIAVIAVSVVAGVIRSYMSPDGTIRTTIKNMKSSQKEGDKAHGRINQKFDKVVNEVQKTSDKVDKTYGKVEQIDRNVQTLQETVYYLHENDERVTSPEDLGDRLGVRDPRDDFMRGGQSDED